MVALLCRPTQSTRHPHGSQLAVNANFPLCPPTQAYAMSKGSQGAALQASLRAQPVGSPQHRIVVEPPSTQEAAASMTAGGCCACCRHPGCDCGQPAVDRSNPLTPPSWCRRAGAPGRGGCGPAARGPAAQQGGHQGGGLLGWDGATVCPSWLAAVPAPPFQHPTRPPQPPPAPDTQAKVAKRLDALLEKNLRLKARNGPLRLNKRS